MHYYFMTLTKEEKKIVKFLRSSKDAGRSSKDIAELLGLSKKNTIKKLNRLKSQKIISQFGTTRVVRYRLIQYEPEKTQENKMYQLVRTVKARQKQEEKKRYRDNAEFHSNLYSALMVFLSELSSCFGIDKNVLNDLLKDTSSFKEVVLNSKMKNLSVNIIDTIFGLKEGILYANETPHSEIDVSERREIKKIMDWIDSEVPTLDNRSGYLSTTFNNEQDTETFSFSAWLMLFIIGNNARDFWENKLRSEINSYEITLKEFLGFLRGLKTANSIETTGVRITFDDEDLVRWINNLNRALSYIMINIITLKTLLDRIQKANGKFEDYIEN